MLFYDNIVLKITLLKEKSGQKVQLISCIFDPKLSDTEEIQTNCKCQAWKCNSIAAIAVQKLFQEFSICLLY